MITLSKPLTTRNGAEVRIYRDSAEGEYPIHGAYKNEDGEWKASAWSTQGRYFLTDSKLDLVNSKTGFYISGYMNIYPESCEALMVFYLTRDRADQAAKSSRIACLPITIKGTVGEGL